MNNEQPPAGTKPDPRNKGHYLGWGVYRMDPWHLAGFYGSQAEAEQERSRRGEGYEAAYGSLQLGTDSFTAGSSESRG